jgi:peptide deformylase
MMRLVYWPDERLMKRCVEVAKVTSEILELIKQMRAVADRDQGIGLAANQVGLDMRVCLVQFYPGESLTALINPVIVNRSKRKILFSEGCLSFPGLMVPVTRHYFVDVEYLDEQGELCVERLDGLGAVCLQHELDHLDGITFLRRLKPRQRKRALGSWRHPFDKG